MLRGFARGKSGGIVGTSAAARKQRRSAWDPEKSVNNPVQVRRKFRLECGLAQEMSRKHPL